MTDSSGARSTPEEATSFHVRRARKGEEASIAWIVDRFTPLLLAQARYRLRSLPSEVYDPADLVQDAWMAALPRMPELPERDGRYTPVLMRFLATALLNRSNSLLQKHVQGKPLRERAPGVLSDRPGHLSGAVTHTLRCEAAEAVHAALQELDAADREVVILRGIEQHRNESVARLLGLKPNTVAVRYRRALQRLRERLEGSAFDELGEDRGERYSR